MRSSSDRIPVSKIIDGRTVTGGTGRTCKINHSGLAVLGSYPRRIKSSLETFTNLSLIVIGNSLFSPTSVFSTKIVGFVKIKSYCSFWQWGQTFTFFAFSMISSLTFSSVITAYGSLLSRKSLYLTRSSLLNLIRLQALHVINNNLWISSINAICKTGSASSICPKCPGHLAEVLPHVAHFCPGSKVPSLPSISPPCTDIPSSS